MINDLQLEIDEKGKILYVWGYCPLINYETTNEFPKAYKFNNLIALLGEPPIPGISYRLNEAHRWLIYINKKKGWVCLGNPKIDNKQLIEFAPNCIAAMDGQEIVAVWLHPEILADNNN